MRRRTRRESGVRSWACQNAGVSAYVPHRGKIVILDEDHVDTDRIIPARFLSRVSRSGYGDLLFADVRGDAFALDQAAAQGASILVVGTNFGCGSSREHAVWAIQQAGYAAVVARRTPESAGYSDIFRQNAANCGLALIELDVPDHARVVALGAGAQVDLDLEAQQLRWGGGTIAFEMAPALKRQLIEGRDLIGITLEHEASIAAHEAGSMQFVPKEVTQ